MVTKRAHICDALVVAIVVYERNIGLLGGCGYEQVHGRNSAMIAVAGEKFLQFPRPRPKLCGHRNRLERTEASRHVSCAFLVGSQANQLQEDQIADEHIAAGYLGVEPGCKLGEATVTCPGPYARVE